MPIANHVMGKLKKYANTKTIFSQIVSSEILAAFEGAEWFTNSLVDCLERFNGVGIRESL